MAVPFKNAGPLLAVMLLTALPSFGPGAAAQEQAPAIAPPGSVAPSVPGIEAPVLPETGSSLTTTAEQTPGLPAAETTAPDLNTAPATGLSAEGGTAGAPVAAADPADGNLSPAPQPAAPASGPALPHELSPWGMFMAADWIVKGVMLGLAFATFVTLTVLVYKFFEVALAKRALSRAAQVIRGAASLEAAAKSLSGRKDPAAFMTQAAFDELTRSVPALDVAGDDGVKERTRSILERTEAQAGRRLMRGTGLLATIGSTSPFVGLFGTVWGIMNSFIGISKSQTTNLAVVAPGIAEALLATAIGLVAAIPAVIIYNHFARQIQGYRVALGDAGAGVERLLSRDLDFRNVTTD